MANWNEKDIEKVDKEVIAGGAEELKALMLKAGSCMQDELVKDLNKSYGRTYYRHEIADAPNGQEAHSIRFSAGFWNYTPIVTMTMDKCKK